MAASDAIVVGEDWISEHYFTTDAEVAVVPGARCSSGARQWDEDAKDGAAHRPIAVRRRPRDARTSSSPTCSTTSRRRRTATTSRRRALRRASRRCSASTPASTSLKQAGPVTPGRARRTSSEAAPLVIVEARAAETVEDLARQGRRDPARRPYEADENDDVHLGRRGCCRHLFVARRRRPSSPWCWPGRWLLVAERERWAEGRYLAVDLQLVCERNDAKRGGEIDRALDLRERRVARARRRRRHLVARRPRGVGQAHRRRLQGPARGRPAVHRDHRQRGGARAARPRASTRCPTAEAQPLAKQSLRFLYRILFLLYAEASPELGVLPVGRAGVRAGLQPRPAARARPGRAGRAAARQPARTSTSRSRRSSGWSTQGHDAGVERRRRRGPARRAGLPPAARRPVRARRRPRSSTRSGSATPRCSRCCGTCC